MYVQVIDRLSSPLALLDGDCSRVCIVNLLDHFGEMLDSERNFEELLGAEISESEFGLLGADDDVAGKNLVLQDHCINMRALIEHIFGIYVHVAELYARSLHFK